MGVKYLPAGTIKKLEKLRKLVRLVKKIDYNDALVVQNIGTLYYDLSQDFYSEYVLEYVIKNVGDMQWVKIIPNESYALSNGYLWFFRDIIGYLTLTRYYKINAMIKIIRKLPDRYTQNLLLSGFVKNCNYKMYTKLFGNTPLVSPDITTFHNKKVYDIYNRPITYLDYLSYAYTIFTPQEALRELIRADDYYKDGAPVEKGLFFGELIRNALRSGYDYWAHEMNKLVVEYQGTI